MYTRCNHFSQEIRILNPAAYTKTNNKTPTVTKMHLSQDSKVGVTLENINGIVVINKEKGKAGRSPVVLGREVDMQGEREKGMDRYEN